MINNVVLVGRMTKDPELRRTNKGEAVTSFTLALNRSYDSADGQQADYIPCVVWGKIAENTEKYCAKGSLVGVEGRLRSRSYDNAQGQKVYVVEVVCKSVSFLSTRNSTQNSEPKQERDPFQNVQTVQVSSGYGFDSFDIMEDDIQF